MWQHTGLCICASKTWRSSGCHRSMFFSGALPKLSLKFCVPLPHSVNPTHQQLQVQSGSPAQADNSLDRHLNGQDNSLASPISSVPIGLDQQQNSSKGTQGELLPDRLFHIFHKLGGERVGEFGKRAERALALCQRLHAKACDGQCPVNGWATAPPRLTQTSEQQQELLFLGLDHQSEQNMLVNAPRKATIASLPCLISAVLSLKARSLPSLARPSGSKYPPARGSTPRISLSPPKSSH